MTEENNVFDRLKAEKTGKLKRVLLVVSGAIFAAAVVTVAFWFVQNRPEESPPASSAEPSAEVGARIAELGSEIGTDLSAEYADMFLSEIDRLIGITHNPDQIAALEDLRFAAYGNSGRYEEAVRAGESFLERGSLTEEWRFHVYDRIATVYAEHLHNPTQLEKYVRLLLNSDELNKRDDADSFPIYYKSALKKQGIDYEE